MPYDRFFIGAFDESSGLHKDVQPFLIPDKAFSSLVNAYQWRGRVRKRFGSRWLGPTHFLTRLKINIGTTDNTGAISGTVPGIKFNVGQAFSIGSAFYTVYLTGANMPMLQTVTTTTATFSTTNGAYLFAGAPVSTDVYYYPSDPVMGLDTYITEAQNVYSLIAFDTQFSYQYEATGWERITGQAQSGASVWTGTDSQLFWATTYSSANAANFTQFVTNFNENEPNFMRYLFNNTWNNFIPQLTNNSVSSEALFLVSAAILLPFHNRLIAINCWEQNRFGSPPYPNPVHYPFRIRWSSVGDPTGTDSWRSDMNGQGSGLDVTTQESCITAEFIKDRLILYFESSTWELVFTGNEIEPFVAQKINTELGAESRFSIVPFDKVAIGWGDSGMHACNGTNVQRIDNSIPDEVFNVHTSSNGLDRVFGIRDYTVEMVYWTYPDPSRSDTQYFPNKILVYNYKTSTWAFNFDSITAFGYTQFLTVPDWSSQTVTWDSTEPWSNNQFQSTFRNIIGGNQEGYTFYVDANEPTNSLNLQITNIIIDSSLPNQIVIQCMNHNFQVGEYIYLNNIIGTGNLNLLNNKIFKISLIDFGGDPANQFEILYDDPTVIINGTYAGNGNIAIVSNIDIYTKQYNFYFTQGRNFYIPQVDFLVDNSFGGEITVDYYTSSNIQSMIQASTSTNTIVGTNVLTTSAYPDVSFEEFATQLWHRIYLQGDGEFIQLRMYFTDAQMRNTDIRDANFVLNAMNFYALATSQRNQ